jgi:lipoyl(octanoyl) transferase
MDLKPFDNINPCGYPDLNVTQLKELDVNLSIDEVRQLWANQFILSFSN